MKMEMPRPHCALLIQQLDTRIEQDRLLVSAPVQISHAGDASLLDQALDALLDDTTFQLQRSLAMAQVKVAESWASDAAGEPLAAIGEQSLMVNGEPIRIHAHWTLESPLGFPDDEQWLGLLVRRALEGSAEK